MINAAKLMLTFFLVNYIVARPPCFPFPHQASTGVFKQPLAITGQVIVDCLRLWYNIFSIESLAILGINMPCYIGTRQYDECLQSYFYQPHKNIHQLPNWCHRLAQYSIGIPFVGLSSMAVCSSKKRRALTGYLTAIGWPMMQSGKDIIKSLEYKCCLRPLNEHFGTNRAMGGFPSGHIASISYLTTLWTLQEGPRWGVPLGLLGIFISADFLSSNRHYLSQLVAGAGLGILFAYAAHSLVEQKINERWYIRPYFDKSLGLSIMYTL